MEVSPEGLRRRAPAAGRGEPRPDHRMQFEECELVAPSFPGLVGEGLGTLVRKFVVDWEAVVHAVGKPSCHFTAQVAGSVIVRAGPDAAKDVQGRSGGRPTLIVKNRFHLSELHRIYSLR